MEENKTTTMSLSMMQANLTEKAVILTRIGEAKGFCTYYYEYTEHLTFSCCGVSMRGEASDPELQSKYDKALKQLVDMISEAEQRARQVLEVIGTINNI